MYTFYLKFITIVPLRLVKTIDINTDQKFLLTITKKGMLRTIHSFKLNNFVQKQLLFTGILPGHFAYLYHTMYRWCTECVTSIRIFVVFSFLLREGIYSGVLNPNSPFSLHLTFPAVKSPDIPIPTIPQHQTHAIFLLRPPFCHKFGATSPLCCQNPKFCRVLRRCFGRLPTHSYVRRYGMRIYGRSSHGSRVAGAGWSRIGKGFLHRHNGTKE